MFEYISFEYIYFLLMLFLYFFNINIYFLRVGKHNIEIENFE